MGERSDLVVVARFEDRRRAWRVRDLLCDHSIRSHLDTTGELLTLAVPRADESRALDILVTLVRGIDIDDLTPTGPLGRFLQPDAIAAAIAAMLIAATTALIAWWSMTLAPAVPVGGVAVIVALGAFNAFRPGRFARKRREAGHRPV